MLCVDVQPPKLILPMSYVPDQHQPPQWSRSEQLALLTTILKDLDPDPASTLFHLIQQRGWQPRWQDIPLPEGRSLNSCISIYEDMRRRSASSSVGHPGYAMTPVMYAAPPPLGPLMPRKRSHNDQEAQSHAQRMLQPKPPRSIDSPLPSATPVTNGESYTFVARTSPAEAAVVKPPAKKRGRPNKDELDRRRAEAEARGEVYPDPSRRKRARPSDIKSEMSPATSSLLKEGAQRSFSAQTPQRQSPEILERSSSGKRRRQKQQRDSDAMIADEDDSNLMNIPKEAQSPSERLLMKGVSSSRSPTTSRVTQQSDTPAAVASGHDEPLDTAIGPSADE